MSRQSNLKQQRKAQLYALDRQRKDEQKPSTEFAPAGRFPGEVVRTVRTERLAGAPYPPELYNGLPPHEVTSDTSRAAAVGQISHSATIRALIYATIVKRGGATDDELEAALNLRHQTASARRRELVLMGLIRDSGERRKTRSGATAAVWIRVPRLSEAMQMARLCS